ADMDRMLYRLVDRRESREQLVRAGFAAADVERVERLVGRSEFKRQMAPVAKLSPRTLGVDYLYPRRRPAPDPP
ncbi:MAG TPA: hypothetical protein VNW68_00855, partial [Candidatus Limnocylindria bacterium]|nr:hypothetical protein [Candidatus Limnocylindria bacterium]